MHLTGNTVLITGGTSGIGRALASALHARGNTVLIAGRRQALLDAITAAHPGMRGYALDVQDPFAIEALVTHVRHHHPELNVLINNAGITAEEDLTSDSHDLNAAWSIIQTNIVAVLHLTVALLPVLKRQPRATIMTTTSGLAFVPRADYPTYCASKAFLHSWLQSLRQQLRETSVEVLELAPPYVQTELSGADQANDPAAMPLDDYVAEVMQALADPRPPRGEVLVSRVRALRFAEQDGAYDQRFALLNAG